MSKILDGKLVSEEISLRLQREISQLKTKPTLAIIQVGEDPRSSTYIKRKKSFGEKIGAQVTLVQLPENISENDFLNKIEDLNQDSNTHGIIVQLPLPKDFNREKITNTISPQKDVDGLVADNPKFVPATALGILSLLKYYNIPIKDQRVVVVGRSTLVGKPTALLLEKEGGLITVCHRGTKNLSQVTRDAHILVVATGVPKLIQSEHVSGEQTVIDVGITVEEGGKLVGDVDFEEVLEIVEHITPVPGGIGPMTVASLFENLLNAYRNEIKGQ